MFRYQWKLHLMQSIGVLMQVSGYRCCYTLTVLNNRQKQTEGEYESRRGNMQAVVRK